MGGNLTQNLHSFRRPVVMGHPTDPVILRDLAVSSNANNRPLIRCHDDMISRPGDRLVCIPESHLFCIPCRCWRELIVSRIASPPDDYYAQALFITIKANWTSSLPDGRSGCTRGYRTFPVEYHYSKMTSLKGDR
ncbi:unnamed protein product [Protopolystoma xenopodis]|uniref:Uncharacterized protein n=1 Tax=Protopolystoma xenopodis TaxID=117903 RepID=A0A3S5AUP4_9PLAT|nr:unnamed protein product [Protopolystoma xenopodis]